ncbi:MAG: hypothetical protein GQ553_01555 [Nitrosomonadaceae bacterium]|nr:hypothetical protein [Nitrosomonadaceae bacterium]
MTKVDIDGLALKGFEESGMQQSKQNWDLYKKGFFEGYMAQHKALRIKMEQAIDMVDGLLNTLK